MLEGGIPYFLLVEGVGTLTAGEGGGGPVQPRSQMGSTILTNLLLLLLILITQSVDYRTITPPQCIYAGVVKHCGLGEVTLHPQKNWFLLGSSGLFVCLRSASGFMTSG